MSDIPFDTQRDIQLKRTDQRERHKLDTSTTHTELPEMTHVSASQIQLFRDCPYKWWREYYLKIKSPSTASQEVGSLTHEVLERYLLTGHLDEDSEYSEIARPGLVYLPPPADPSYLVEEEVWIRDTPAPVKGFIDLRYTHEDGRPVVLDHKTSKSQRWIKTPSDLLQNVQMVTYAHYVFSKVPCDYVWVKHVYYGTTSRWSKEVEVKMSRPWVERVWAGIVSTIEEMVKYFHAAESTIPKRLNACSMYGGCFHKPVCQESDMADSNLLEKLGIGPVSSEPKPTTAESVSKSDATQPKILLGVNPPESEDILTPNLVGIDDDPPAEQPKPARAKRVRHPETDELISKAERDRDFEKVGGEWKRRAKHTIDEDADDCPFDIPLPSPRLRVLAIGCLPVKLPENGVLKPLDEIIAPIAQKHCQDAGVNHISLIRYGAGYDSVAGAVANKGWPDGVDIVYVDPMAKGSDRIIPILTTLADMVLRKTS